VQEQVKLPPGYSISWSGQYEYMLRAHDKLLKVVPVTLLIIFLLLYLIFRRAIEAVMVLLRLPESLQNL
jgi:Cu(I)/Ag(I) efflux system membrane protein CusA/SilA